MGQTLVVLAERTASDGGRHGKVEQTEPNNVMLKKFLEFLDTKITDELGKFQFVSPMSWPTTLEANDLSGSGCTVNGDEAISEAKSTEGEPMLTLKIVNNVPTVTIMSLEHGNIVLSCADSKGKKTVELRHCLEANNDPVAKICGERFSTIHGPNEELVRYIQSGGAEGKDEAEKQHNKTLAVLLTSFHQLDRDTLREIFQVATSTTRLTPDEVDRWVDLLKLYCGKDETKNLLEELDYFPEYSQKLQSGCRALPKRQIHGEICYLVAVPHDTEPVYITATTEGYFVSPPPVNGRFTFGRAEGEETYKALIPLLRNKSPLFNELIDNEEIFQQMEDDKEKGIVDTTGDLNGEEGKYDKGHNEEVQRRQQGDDQKTEKKKRDVKKKKLEPSLKWRNLTIEEHREIEKKEEKKKKLKPLKKQHDNKKHSASDAEDSFEESSSESEEEEEAPDRRQDANTDLPSEYWQIQKLVKYLKSGNQTATIIALCSMRDFNLSQETCQLAIRDVGGLEVLINLLDTDEIKCKIGSLKILKEISKNTQIRRAIADLGGLQTMVKILRDPMANKELKCLVAETIANVAKFIRARRTVRQHGGIKKLVGLLDIPPPSTYNHLQNAAREKEHEKDIEVACTGAMALWSCSKSKKNKQAMRKAGAIPLLAKLLKSENADMLIPVVGTLQECASEPNYRLAIRTEGMVEDLVKNLSDEHPQELQMHCASAIFKCAEEKETRDLVRDYGGLEPLVALLGNKENKDLLAAATGAIWKCAISPENVVRFQQLKAIDQLVGLLTNQPEEVLVNVVGALAELAKEPENRMTIRKAGGIQQLVNLLTGTNQALLINVTKAVGRCAEEPENMAIIDKLDGVRLLWSLLKNPNMEVKASAAWAICPCIENAKDAGEMVRSFVGGLELIVGLLHVKDEQELSEQDIEVLASVCAAIANIANDEENLAVITDHNVVSMLSKLTNTNNDKLRRHLAEAIARCCNWGQNRIEFGRQGAVAPLVRYLKAKDPEVHRSTAKALFQLSKDPDNCITMHEAGVVKPLMEMVGSNDEILQEAAAGCIANIRRLALANEKAKTNKTVPN